MKQYLSILPFLLISTSALAADSAVLKEIMGESVYESSGIGGLSEDQLEVLENWILNNAVEKRVVTRSKPERQARPAKPGMSVESSAASLEEPGMEEPEEHHTPHYVRLAEPQQREESPEEEPVTRKYVLVESLERKDREQVRPDLIRSRIDGPFKGWKNNKTHFRLENGEIWEQRQSGTYLTNLDSPEVIIRKGRFGYTMEVPAIGRKVHVKKIR